MVQTYNALPLPPKENKNKSSKQLAKIKIIYQHTMIVQFSSASFSDEILGKKSLNKIINYNYNKNIKQLVQIYLQILT